MLNLSRPSLHLVCSRAALVLSLAAVLAACSSDTKAGPGGGGPDSSVGGGAATGGSASGGKGGTAGSGGTASGGTAGSGGTASGGAAGSGGSASGGTAGSGGTASGGTAGSGGTASGGTGGAGGSSTDAGTDGAAGAPSGFQCGTAPYSPFAAAIVAGGGATLPPSAHLRSNICAAGTFLDIPLSLGGVFQGQGTIYLQNTPQFVTATASDDSAYPFLTQEFTSLADAPIPILKGLPFTLAAKTSALHPPGYSPGAGNAYILIQLNKSKDAAPCNGDDGITISLVGSAHPEAIVYYVTSTTAYSTTGPSVTGKENVSIILKPSSALEYVQIMGTKPSCSVDTGITATSNLRKIGFTGLIPIAPDSTTFAQASVAAP
jgi:hypothetical protein